MKDSYRVLVYGDYDECHDVKKMLCALPGFSVPPHEFKYSDNWDDLEVQLVDWDPTWVIVVEDGAAGMEGVYLSNARKPGVPVCWFSDDRDFGMQSHRLECVYFAPKPVTEDKIQKAIKRYINM